MTLVGAGVGAVASGTGGWLRTTWPMLLLCACGEWPRWQHIDPAGVPLDALPATDWLPVVESEPNDEAARAQAITLTVDAPTRVAGTLAGVGWCDAERWGDACLPATDPGCGTPIGWGGRYAADVDQYAVTVSADTPVRLCVAAAVPGAVFDVLLLPLPGDCPSADPILVDDTPLGWSLGPDAGGWSTAIAPGRYLLQTAGALRTDGGDPAAEVSYDLGLSLQVEIDGAYTRCPSLTDPEGA